MKLYIIIATLGLSTFGCDFQKIIPAPTPATVTPAKKIITNTLNHRIKPPAGYTRIPVPLNSFAHYLRNHKLKPSGSLANYYNEETKPASGIYMAVLDLEIGDKDLHQCADAIMRLKADYHYYAQEYDRIKFNFTNGHRVAYSEWRKGKRIKVDGNKTTWIQTEKPSTSYAAYWDYMEQIFMYAGTYSLSKEMKSVPLKDMQVGDVLIKGGFPGHGVIVMDMAIHESSGQKLYLLAQSYMPAQQTQILINPNDAKLSPWYVLELDHDISTPEYTFVQTDLKRFSE